MQVNSKDSSRIDNNDSPKSSFDEQERTRLEDFLITGLGFDGDFVKSLTDAQISQLVKNQQDEKVEKMKNPNSFWVIKGLPVPVLPKPTGPARHGLYIFLGFLAFFLIFIAVLLAVLLTRR